MDDLLGSFDSTPAKTLSSRMVRPSKDLLSFDTDSHNTPVRVEERNTHDIADFVNSSPVTQWREKSTPGSSPYVNNGKQNMESQEDDFGDFQGFTEAQVSSIKHDKKVMAMSFPPIDRTSHNKDLGDEDDEFGEFVDSPLPAQDNFPVTSPKAPRIEVPGPAALLRFLLDHVLQVPTAFIRELATLSYSLKKVVLNHTRTKQWILAVLEGSRVAQRIIQGRQRRVKQKKEWKELQIVTERVSQHWKDTLMPRLSSLGGTTLKTNPLKTNAFNDNYDKKSVCQICYTEGDESAMLQQAEDGRLYHTSCEALLRAMQTEQIAA